MSDHDQASDEELVSRYVRGEQRAFDDIVQRYHRRVYAIALRMTGNPEDARDVCQDVFINAMRALRRFRGDAMLSTWFHRVAINASTDHLRRQRRHLGPGLDDVPERAADEPDPAERAEGASRAEAVHAGLKDISDEHRAVLVLHDLQGLDYAEVADVLGVPLGTVKSRIHRARSELARRLGHLRETEPQGG
jgi:RNA polymerase sigma-70 factor (ECF subfamily)